MLSLVAVCVALRILVATVRITRPRGLDRVRLCVVLATWLGVAVLLGPTARAGSSDAPIGTRRITDPRNPPYYRLLGETDAAQVTLGKAVFSSQWVAAGTPGATRTGVGPLFNAASCDACHSDGTRGRGPTGDGPVPVALVIQLESPAAAVGTERRGDPVYGRVLNTAALDGAAPAEGVVTVRYREIGGYYYPDGTRWRMRVPQYHLVGLNHGPLAPTTVIKPRVAPSLFGVGLLEAVAETAINDEATVARSRGASMIGRFGWQGASLSIRDQTTKAFAREMGLTSGDRPSDDCTPAESDCLRQPNAGSPEVSEELLNALVAFERALAVPESPTQAGDDASEGSRLFADIGCAGCHRQRLPVELPEADGTKVRGVIAPYTDLRLHDLGVEMADENVSGAKVTSRWRTAPLWGLGYRIKTESHPTFLHDGRARSAEEAILWHSGEAAPARHKFIELWRRPREALLRWVESL